MNTATIAKYLNYQALKEWAQAQDPTVPLGFSGDASDCPFNRYLRACDSQYTYSVGVARTFIINEDVPNSAAILHTPFVLDVIYLVDTSNHYDTRVFPATFLSILEQAHASFQEAAEPEKEAIPV